MKPRKEMDDVELERRLADAWQATPSPPAGARDRLIRALRDIPPPRRRAGLLGWWLAPLPMRVNPLAALAALVAVAAIAWLAARAPFTRTRVEDPAPVAMSASSLERPMAFVLVAPGARTVALVGDFNDWDAHATPMAHAAGGAVWRATVPLSPGLHLYGFVVDGARWAIDPSAPLVAGDTYGARNSVVVGDEL